MSGAEDFTARHALVVTWKNVTFLGNSVHDIRERPVSFYYFHLLIFKLLKQR